MWPFSVIVVLAFCLIGIALMTARLYVMDRTPHTDRPTRSSPSRPRHPR